MSVQVLEMCVNHCGEKFHNEVAKFRFLNELIKVLSPKVSTVGLALFPVLYLPPSFHLLSPRGTSCPEVALLTAEPASLSPVCDRAERGCPARDSFPLCWFVTFKGASQV